MAGKSTSQNTAAAPAGNTAPASPPAADVTTGGNTPAPVAAPAATAPAKKRTPASAPALKPTVVPEVDFDAEMRALQDDIEQGTQTEPKGGKTETPKPKAAKPDADTPGEDPLDQEMDEAEAAAAQAKLTVKKDPEPEPETVETEQTPTGEDEPDVGDPKYAKWLKSLSPDARKKIERQQKQINTLKAAAAQSIQIAPTAESPLAHVETPEQLDAETGYWTQFQQTIKALQRAYRDNPDTELEITLPDGKKYRFESIEQVDHNEDYAGEKLKAVPEARARIDARNGSKPWDVATKLVPDLFEKDSAANKEAIEILRKVPQFKTAFPDWEVKLAHMLRSMHMDSDKKRKWVPLDLDDEGNVILPRRAVAPKTPAPRVPTAAPASRPALTPDTREQSLKAAISKAEQSGSDDDFRAAVKLVA